MERRTLLAVVLSFVVVYAYQAFFVPKVPEPGPSVTTESPETSGAAASPEGRASAPPPPQAVQAAPQVDEFLAAIVVGDTEERDVVVETDAVRAVFTNRGGRLKNWILKNYTDTSGRLVDLVPDALPADQPLPFSLGLDEGGIGQRLNGAMFLATTREDGNRLPGVVFDYQDESGLLARKEFRFGPNAFEVTFTTSVRQGGQELNPSIEWGPGLGDLRFTGGGSFPRRVSVPTPEAVFHDGEDVTRLSISNAAESPSSDGTFSFVGVNDHYFIAAAVNTGPLVVEYRPITLPASDDPDGERQLLIHMIRPAQPSMPLRYYIGPKSFEDLKAVDGELVRAIDFGFLAFIAVPFLSALKWIYGYVGNYGWSIIFLTILMNLVMSPLRHKSVVSMRKMQEIQPQLKAIQDRYAGLKATDPARQKMNSEVMGLYREKGANPASGCIPMLLQFPFLFAFYSLLSQAVELRGAPFGFWIQDLSTMDPYYVTPLLMGATMFWQQRLTPATGDPTQQRMMMFMPVVFVAMFLTFPSGLAIYYFTQNLCAIGQQIVTNRIIGPLVVHAQRPAAERRVKSAGAGRTARAEQKP